MRPCRGAGRRGGRIHRAPDVGFRGSAPWPEVYDRGRWRTNMGSGTVRENLGTGRGVIPDENLMLVSDDGPGDREVGRGLGRSARTARLGSARLRVGGRARAR